MTLARGHTWTRTYSVTAYENADKFDMEAAYKEFGNTRFD